ncbi:MAG: CdaR family protein [Anaerolineales bacterium]|nr:CdaR family protein [Anaerolineales bacterium]
MIGWLRENLGTLFLAFILSISAWVAAISAEDPLQQQVFLELVPIEYRDLQSGLTIVGDLPQEAEVTIRAPSSVWRNLSQQDLAIYADLAGLEAGVHRVQIEGDIDQRATQITEISPGSVSVTIEPLATKQVDIRVILTGEPGADYAADEPVLEIEQITLKGPRSAVDDVESAQIRIDLNNRQRSIDQQFPLTPVDAQGNPVEGVELEQESVSVQLQITKRENIRRLVVVPIVEGREQLEEDGYYRLTRISVDPTEVAVFSEDPVALEALPGFIQTEPLNIANLTEDQTRTVALDLPEDFTLVGVQSVDMTVEIETVETSIVLTRPVQIANLGFGLFAYPSPEEVSIILTGPKVILDQITSEQVKIVVDLEDLSIGVYQLDVEISDVPDQVSFEEPNPPVIEVEITFTPRPTPTATFQPES